MSFKARTIPAFERHAKPLLKKYPSLRGELKSLVLNLMERPEQGTPLGMGCYKIHLAIASKGKGRSGGARVVTCVYTIEKTIWSAHHFRLRLRESLRRSKASRTRRTSPTRS